MVEMNEASSQEFIDAIRCWTGWGDHVMPTRDDARLVSRFGSERGAQLLGEIKSLEDACYLSDAHMVASDIQDMAVRCARDLERKRPGIPKEIVDALVWCYTFDYK